MTTTVYGDLYRGDRMLSGPCSGRVVFTSKDVGSLVTVRFRDGYVRTFAGKASVMVERGPILPIPPRS